MNSSSNMILLNTTQQNLQKNDSGWRGYLFSIGLQIAQIEIQ